MGDGQSAARNHHLPHPQPRRRPPQVNIYCDCPLWPDDSMCSLRACSVCECEEGEVPKPWLAAERGLKPRAGRDGSCQGAAQPDCDAANCECRPGRGGR
jgi:hypothetical protein